MSRRDLPILRRPQMTANAPDRESTPSSRRISSLRSRNCIGGLWRKNIMFVRIISGSNVGCGNERRA